MAEPIKGWVHGNTITLDAPIPPWEGQIVRVILEPVAADEDMRLAPEMQAALWQEWVDRGPQGPIDDEGELDFP